MTAAELIVALIRTTLVTAVAACAAALLLAALKVDSPRIHRASWALVVLQGWLLFPWTLKLESPPSMPAVHTLSTGAVRGRESFATGEPITVESFQSQKTPDPVRVAPLAVVAWLSGAALLALAAAWRYLRIVRTLPLGAAPDNPQWQREWRRERARAMPNRRGLAHFAQSAEQYVPDPLPRRFIRSPRVDFRLTERLGPLVAYIPFAYLLLAPRPLWSALTPVERTAILRHELAHIRRRDLWKSLALRLLALPQWFNPLVWLAVRRFDEAAEWACDDAAAACGLAREPTTVARALLRTAELTVACTPPPRAAGLVPAVPCANDKRRRSTLARRIHRLVTPRFKEESTMRKLAVPALLAAIAAAQLVRIERVAAASYPPPSKGGVRGGIEDAADMPAAEGLSATTLRQWVNKRWTVRGPGDAATRNEYVECKFPRYIIEPPDILLIEGVKLVPKPPYRIETFDVILIRVLGAFPEQPIDDAYTVDADGTVNLGPQYGRIKIAGLTMEEGEKRVRVELAKILTDVEVSFSLRLSAGFQAISGQHLVAMDGRVNLGIYGSAFVAGMTIEQAREAIEQLLSAKLEDPQVSVDVLAYNSKVYYVIMKGSDLGDNVTRLPVTGNETVLDAIANLGGIRSAADAKVWIARPAPNGVGAEKILTVNWDEIGRGASMATNYQLLPGDRLFIESPRAKQKQELVQPPTTPALPPTPVDETPTSTRGHYDAVNPAIPRTDSAPSIEYSVLGIAPTTTAPAAPTPAPGTVIRHVEPNQITFKISVIRDRTGDMAELGRDLRETGFMRGDTATMRGALRILAKHGMTSTLADPTVVTTVGRPAAIEMTTAPPHSSDKDDDEHLIAIELNPRSIGRDEEGQTVHVEIKLTKGGAVQRGVRLHLGETVVLATRTPHPPHEKLGAGWTYVVLTPELVD